MYFVILFTVLATPPELAPPPRAVVPDTAASRSVRWVLRLKVQSGQDYVDQLKRLGAYVVVQDPSDSNKAIFIPDLAMPKKRREATAKELAELAEKIKFSDHRKDAVQAVAKALELDFTPKAFWAFLPKEVEGELAQKEKEYCNRKIEEIEETIFRILVRDGKVEITVQEQSAKKKP